MLRQAVAALSTRRQSVTWGKEGMRMTQKLDGLTPAEAYETFFVPAMFRPLARRLVEIAKPAPGEQMLDLAAGTGVVGYEFAPHLGKKGRVVCSELLSGMVAAGRALAQPEGAPVEWIEANAENLPLADASFDLAVCQQGFQFFGERAEAARELRRILRPGGRAVIACWEGLERQEFFRRMAEAEDKHLRADGLDPSDLYAPFSFGDAAALADLFRDAGFSRVAVSQIEFAARYPADNFVRNVEYAYSAVVPEFVADPEKFERFVAGVERDIAGLLAEYSASGRLEFPMRTNVAVAVA
jgi:ubiquinone/menaquinone biosynthesis C-methylase UbiE